MKLTNNKSIKIDIFSDIVCPWCYIGLKNLENAFLNRNQLVPRYIWHAFFLNPDLPKSGIDREQYLKLKFGKNVDSVYKNIQKSGEKSGVFFNFSKISKTPNTKIIHKIIISSNNSKKISEIFFKSYFIEGKDISNENIIKNILLNNNINYENLEKKFIIAEKKINKDLNFAINHNINSVPVFIFNDEYLISGAHSKKIFLNILDTISN